MRKFIISLAAIGCLGSLAAILSIAPMGEVKASGLNPDPLVSTSGVGVPNSGQRREAALAERLHGFGIPEDPAREAARRMVDAEAAVAKDPPVDLPSTRTESKTTWESLP